MIHHENVVAPEPVLQLPGPGPLEEPKDEENQEKPADQYETMASILQDLEAEDEENQEKPKKKEDWRFWRFLREREILKIFKKKIIMTISDEEEERKERRKDVKKEDVKKEEII